MRSTLKYGLITGIAVSICATGFFTIASSFNSSQNWGLQASLIRGISGGLTIAILVFGITVAMLAVKKQNYNTLTYLQAIKTGILIACITAVITALGSFIYCTYINPGYAQYMLAEAQKVMVAQGENKQQIADHSIAVRNTYTTGMQVMQSLVGQFVSGTVMSLILGLFLRTKDSKTASV